MDRPLTEIVDPDPGSKRSKHASSILVLTQRDDQEWLSPIHGMQDIKCSVFKAYEDSLDDLIQGKFALLFIDQHHPEAEEFLSMIEEAGIRCEAYALIDQNDENLPHIDLGGRNLPTLQGGPEMAACLRHILRLTHRQNDLIDNFRTEKNDLIRQMLDLRDEHERVQQQSMKLVEMAEDLEISKQSLELLNREKDKLFSIVAHDLRSPFNAILGYAELLSRTADTLTPAQIKEYAKSAHLAATNVFKLMQTLLEWARIQLGNMEFQPEYCRVTDLVDGTLAVYTNIANRKGITLEPVSSDFAVHCDKGMIETVFRNLINNAVKFTGEDGRVEILCEDKGDFIHVSVADTGVGMNETQIAECFSMNSDTKSLGTAGETGTGLGLIMCKDLVEKNGGTITIHSEPGNGSTFEVTLRK